MAYSKSVMDLPPSRLFKYRSFDLGHESGKPFTRDREIVEGNALWASSPTTFNDPFDCIPAIDLSGTPLELEAFAERVAARQALGKTQAEGRRRRADVAKALRNGFALTEDQSVQAWTDLLPHLGVVCLAGRADDMLMWSYYSDSHRGYCLDFDTKAEPIMQAHRVIYSAKRAVFRLLDPDRTELMERTLLRKADFWAHECEWRIVSRPVGHLKFPPAALKAIVLGANISVKSEQALRDMIAGRTPAIELKRAKLDRRTFRLSIVAA